MGKNPAGKRESLYHTLRTINILFLAVLLFIPGCGEAPDTDAGASSNEQASQKQIAEFASQYNAVTNWNESLTQLSGGFFERSYTFEIENELVRKDGRPVLILAALEDISQEDNTYLLYFTTSFLTGGISSPTLRFVLDAEQDLVDKIISGTRGFFDMYAIIATISSVSNPALESIIEHSRDNGDTFLGPTDIVVAWGQCIDLVPHN